MCVVDQEEVGVSLGRREVRSCAGAASELELHIGASWRLSPSASLQVLF